MAVSCGVSPPSSSPPGSAICPPCRPCSARRMSSTWQSNGCGSTPSPPPVGLQLPSASGGTRSAVTTAMRGFALGGGLRSTGSRPGRRSGVSASGSGRGSAGRRPVASRRSASSIRSASRLINAFDQLGRLVAPCARTGIRGGRGVPWFAGSGFGLRRRACSST